MEFYQLILLIAFVVGYTFIALEHPLKLQKSAIALAMGALSWTILSLVTVDQSHVLGMLGENLTEIAAIAFFLLGAMTIVEVIDSHQGFAIIPKLIKTNSKKKLLVLVSVFTFVLSAFLDNLTSTIVMIAVVRRLTDDSDDILVFGGMIILASNAGGVFSPIGDITTTMLWISGRLSTGTIVTSLFFPALMAMAIPLLFAVIMLKGEVKPRVMDAGENKDQIHPDISLLVLVVGVLLLVSVPVFHLLTGLPPYMAILFALGIFWLLTELIHKKNKRDTHAKLGVTAALRAIDLPSILFFVGILLAVGALQSAGMLLAAANWLDEHVKNLDIVMVVLGAISAIIDNVPLVSAAISMYPLDRLPQDNYIWSLLAYTAGTGGSMLIIGSAAGVAAMGTAKIRFGWYLKHFTPLASIGYLAGLGTFYLGRIFA